MIHIFPEHTSISSLTGKEDKMRTETFELKNGTMTVMDFGSTAVHVYGTGDALNDQVIILENRKEPEKRSVVVEQPCFRNTIDEITEYIKEKGLNVEGKMISYHAAGAEFLPNVKAYMTENARTYNTVGGGKNLVDSFIGTFGAAFDGSTTVSGEIIPAGDTEIVGIKMIVRPDNDAYEVEIPSIRAVYMHMLGHDCHSIVAGAGHADAIISNLKGYLDRGYELFLSSHYGPENRADVETKIAYLNGLKEIAQSVSSAEDFMAEVESRYPGYSGENYLGMTAGFFFPQ